MCVSYLIEHLKNAHRFAHLKEFLLRFLRRFLTPFFAEVAMQFDVRSDIAAGDGSRWARSITTIDIDFGIAICSTADGCLVD